MWPETLDISDGYFITFSPKPKYPSESKGFRSQHLVDAWEKAEIEAEPKGEWQELMTWILYKNLHQIAKASFLNQVYSFGRESVRQDIFQIKDNLVDNLRHPDYKEMLKEYFESNQ
jgi:hypothetical protein